MFDFFTPANWFWILMALALSCYLKLQAPKSHIPGPSFSPASIVSIFRSV